MFSLMSKILKYILFRTILILVTLHAIIPHPHSEELTDKEHLELHKNSNSLIGIIKFTFHESDDKSLDNLIFTQYKSVKKIDFKHTYFNISIFDSSNLQVEKVVTKKIRKWNVNNFNKLLFVKLNGLRGPPLLS